VHVIAHGAPGQVVFAAGEWSVQTVESEADDLAAIGRSLAAEGKLQVWSCDTARGEAGEAFVETLKAAAGAEISAATTRIGATALGGTWQLRSSSDAPQPPLTMVGMARYAAVLSFELTIDG